MLRVKASKRLLARLGNQLPSVDPLALLVSRVDFPAVMADHQGCLRMLLHGELPPTSAISSPPSRMTPPQTAHRSAGRWKVPSVADGIENPAIDRKKRLMTRLALLALSVVVLGLTTTTAQAATLRCGSALVRFEPEGEGSAHQIRATRVSCRRARVVARACIGGYLDGWRATKLRDYGSFPRHDRIRLSRGSAVVTFELVGGGTDCSEQ